MQLMSRRTCNGAVFESKKKFRFAFTTKSRKASRRKYEQIQLVDEGLRSLSTVGNDGDCPARADIQLAAQL
jgi:hypothetical protein